MHGVPWYHYQLKMWQLVILLTILVLMNSTASQFSDCITCTDGNTAPYYITQPSTDYVQIVSPDEAVVTLTCSLNVTIPADMTIIWIHNDSVVLTITTEAEQTSNTVSLKRGGARPSHTGLYQCVFNDNAGHVLRRNITLLVILTPKIIQPPADFHRVTFDELTSSVRLMCSLNITIPSSVTVVWTQNGNTVMGTRRKRVTQVGNTTTLQIRNPRPKDAGDYQCVFNGLNLQRIVLLEFQNSGTTSTPTFAISLTVSTNMATDTSYSTTEYADDHSTSSTVTLITTSTTTTVSTSSSLSITTGATSTNIMYISSPTLSTSRSDDSINFSSVGVIVVIAALVVVCIVIITVVVVGIVVVYHKRKKSKQYNKGDDVNSNSTNGATTLQRFSTHTPEPVNNETSKQDSKEHQHQYVNIPEGIQPTKEDGRVPDNVYSIPYCQIKMEPNPAYKPTTGTIRLSELKYY